MFQKGKLTKMGKPAEILKSEKGVKIIFAVGIALIVVIFLLGVSGDKEKSGKAAEENAVYSEIEEYERRLEQRIGEIIATIEGTGEANVMVTLERTEKGSAAASLTPSVRGVAVVCKGCDSAVVRQKVTDAVCKALGVNAAKVCITY